MRLQIVERAFFEFRMQRSGYQMARAVPLWPAIVKAEALGFDSRRLRTGRVEILSGEGVVYA